MSLKREALRGTGLQEFESQLGFISSLFFSCLYLQHMEVHTLRVESELQLPAYTIAKATWDPSCIFNLHHSSWQCQILNPLREVRDQICIFMDTMLGS